MSGSDRPAGDAVLKTFTNGLVSPAFLVLAVLVFGLPATACARLVTEYGEVRELVQRVRQMKPPLPHHIVRNAQTTEAGRVTRRVDEYMADTQARYWRMTEWEVSAQDALDTSPGQRVVEQLLLRQGPDGRPVLLETGQPARSIASFDAPTMGYPLGFFSIPDQTAAGLSLLIEGDVATLEYEDVQRGRLHREIFDLRSGLLRNSKTIERAVGRSRTVEVVRFETQAPLAAGWIEPIKSRLELNAAQAASDRLTQTLWRWFAMAVGGLLPVFVAVRLTPLGRAGRRWGRWAPGMEAVATTIVCLIALVAAGALITDGLAMMILTGVAWTLVQALPREVAMVMVEGVCALMLSSAASVMAWLILRRRRAERS